VLTNCKGKDIPFSQDIFPNNTDPVESDIYKGGIFLGCEFGLMAMYVWGVGVMAAGQSSTMTGTYAGQFVMEGFLQIQWPRWRRVLFTRAIAIVPTLVVALLANGVNSLTGMNDLLNCIQMIQLPFALLPIITFTSHHKIMFEYSSSRIFQGFALFISMIVISINLYFSTDYIVNALGTDWYVWILLIVPSVVYLAFVLYLIFVCLQSMGIVNADFYEKISFLSQNPQITVKAPWLNTNSSSSLALSRSFNASGVDNLAFNSGSSTQNVNQPQQQRSYGSSYTGQEL